ncbi:hypothetical protein ScPMuIL_000420 [Solemya velum]
MEGLPKSVVAWSGLILALCVVFNCVGGYTYGEDGCASRQVHIAFGNTTSDIVVLWATKFANCSTEVRYGDDTWDMKTVVPGSAYFFSDTDFNYIHRVILSNLEANKTYYYRPGQTEHTFYFKTTPDGTDWAPDIIVYGDLGVDSETINVLADKVSGGQYNSILHLGDIAYNLRDDGGRLGDQFMQRIQSMASKVPYLTSPGNHESDDDTFLQYRYRFSMPHTDYPIPLDRMWYSVDIGPIHFISYSTEVFFTNGEAYVRAQHDWLIRDLEKANERRDKQPWVIAYGHQPLYCAVTDDEDCAQTQSLVRIGLEDLFYIYGVDVVLQSHEHLYERLWPMYRGTVLSKSYVNPNAPIQIISGLAGSQYGPTPVAATNPDWCAVHIAERAYPSYGRLKVYNDSHLYWEQIGVNTDIIHDYVWIIKETHGPYNQSALPEELQTKVQDSITKITNQEKALNAISAGGSQKTLDGETIKTEEMDDDDDNNTMQIAIGTSFAVFVLLFIIGIVTARKIKQKPSSYRRWDTVDYGRKFYSNVQDADIDTDDFEVDVTDGTLPTSKLLTEEQACK